MAVNPLSPPQEFFRLGNLAFPPHHLGNMAIRPLLRPPVHYGFGDQLANMQAVQPALPPPHFFGFGYGDQFANIVRVPAQRFFMRHDYQLGGMHFQSTRDLPAPPHFFGHEAQYMAIPPPLRPPVQFFTFGDERANINALPPLLAQYMAIPPPLQPPVHYFTFGDQRANINALPPL